MEDFQGVNIASFNQAGFQQLRIHELFVTIDRCSVNPLMFNPYYFEYNYNVIFNNLNAVLSYLYPKLKDDDKKEIMNKRNELKKIIQDDELLYSKSHPNSKKKLVNQEVWNSLNEAIFNYRLLIECLADKHGLGNPNKEDPSRAIVSN